MILLIILLVAVWLVCINAIMNDAQAEYETNKRKFEVFVKSEKFYPILKGNGQATDKQFLKGEN